MSFLLVNRKFLLTRDSHLVKYARKTYCNEQSTEAPLYRAGTRTASFAMRGALLGAMLVVFSGCELVTVQSMLDPAGPAATEIDKLWWLMFAMGTAVFVIVMAFLAYAVSGRDESEKGTAPPLGDTSFIVWGGLIVPALVLVVLLVFALNTHATLQTPEGTLTVEVVGHQWWWEVQYPEENITTANEIHIPVGRPVRLELLAEDVIHSFWVPRLGGKRDLLPGKVNVFWIEADQPGIYRGQCAEYCGLQHANMAFRVVAHEPEEFDGWVERRQQPAPRPATPAALHGERIFLVNCAHCHVIDGTGAEGAIGPDLTDIASRLTLGAGIVENNRGNLSGWIINPQAIKPGNRMPPTRLDPDDLHALVNYLSTLE